MLQSIPGTSGAIKLPNKVQDVKRRMANVGWLACLRTSLHAGIVNSFIYKDLPNV